MGLLRIMMPPKLQLLAVVAFAVAMLFLENQIQKLEESRAKLEVFPCVPVEEMGGVTGLWEGGRLGCEVAFGSEVRLCL
ncbi:Hs2st1 [Phodopus roborovskii]|uniref:Hs2st1 protein n=1 Tax=Phodopus roborovskii TaxID=109678 RepID=A0AAU9YR42_PHORO|nr:Hs2st1 [Phodopus roborovskii]